MRLTLLSTVLFIFTFSGIAQTFISGSVSDKQLKLEGASVIIKGTTQGVATNATGEFKIETQLNDTLSISYLGYKTQNIVIKKQKSIEVVLEVGNLLDEVEIVTFTSKIRCTSTICYTHTTRCSVAGVQIEHLKDNQTQIKNSKLYPNPSKTGVFNLSLLKTYKDVQVHVSNIKGQLLQSNNYQNVSQKLSLNLSTYNTGIYIISIIADGVTLPSKKAVKG